MNPQEAIQPPQNVAQALVEDATPDLVSVLFVVRWRHKGGVQDLKKARHYIDKLIEVEEANGSHS
jgi:hypothetical protein